MHLHSSALRDGRRTHAGKRAKVHLNAGAVLACRGARNHNQARHGTNTGKRLAAKTVTGNVHQVIRRGDLACGVRRHSQQQFVGANTASIVGHFNQLSPAAFNAHFNFSGAGVKRIFDQLLHDTRWALHHFARGDLIDQVL